MEAAKRAALAAIPAFAGGMTDRQLPPPGLSHPQKGARTVQMSDDDEAAEAARKQQRAQRFALPAQRATTQAPPEQRGSRQRIPEPDQGDNKMGEHGRARAALSSIPTILILEFS